MPKITADLEQHVTAGGFSFSAATIDSSIAPEQTLFTLCVDVSGSVASFAAELEKCVESVVLGCKKDPRADFQMLRVLLFADTVKELHGFKPVVLCQPEDYRGIIQPSGMTAAYEAATNAAEATDAYAAALKARDRDSNAIVVLLTDGVDNKGAAKGITIDSVRASFAQLVTNEHVESVLPILIGVNIKDDGVRGTLAKLETDGGFAQFVDLKDANPTTLAKVAGFVSQSVSAQSRNVNSGGASKPLDPAGFSF